MNRWNAFAAILATLFACSAWLQLNDPDPIRWFVLYAGSATVTALAIFARVPRFVFVGVACIAGAWAMTLVPGVIAAAACSGSEEERELAGLVLVTLGTALLAMRRRSEPGSRQRRS